MGIGTVDEVTRRDLTVVPLVANPPVNNGHVIAIYQQHFPRHIRGLLDEIMDAHWNHDTLHPNLVAVISNHGVKIDDPLRRVFVGKEVPEFTKKAADELYAFAEQRAQFLAGNLTLNESCRFDIEITYLARLSPQYEELKKRLTPFGLTRSEWIFLNGYHINPRQM